MRSAITIAHRDFKSSFVTPLAYVVLAGFIVLAGFFFFTWLGVYNKYLERVAMLPEGVAAPEGISNANLNEWVIMRYYETLQLVLVFLIPLLTMRAIAEEKRNGT